MAEKVSKQENIPLPNSTLAIGLVGFFVSIFMMVYNSIPLKYSFALALFFFLLILASYITMAPKDID